MRSGKMEFETLAKILLLTAFLIVVLLLFKGCMDSYRDLGSVGIREYTCWSTNVMKANVLSLWPSTCREQIVKDKVDTKTFGKLLGTCWWQYGQGEWDLGGKMEESLLSTVVPMDIIHTCYTFMPKEDIKVDELKLYMETYNVKGEKVKKVEDTMWNYAQKTSQGDNVCFDGEDGGILKKEEIYYIKFIDNRAWINTGRSDMLLISSNQKFFDFYPPKTPAQLIGWIGQYFQSEPCYEYGGVKGTGETTFRKLEELTTKIEECIKKDTEKECYCDSISLTQLPEKYKVFAAQGSGKSSMIQVVDAVPPGRMIPVKGAQLLVICPGIKEESEFPGNCNKIIFDNTGLVRDPDPNIIRIGVPEDYGIEKPCCLLEGTWHIFLKEETVDKTKTKKIILAEYPPGRLQKCGNT